MNASKILMAMILGGFLIIVGCSKDETNHEKVNDKSYLPEFIFEEEVFPPSPKGMIEVVGNDYEMVRGGYSWVMGEQAIETDALAPPQIAEHFDAIQVEVGKEVRIEVEQDPKLSVFLWEDDEKTVSVQLNENQMTVPEHKGRHIYEVRAVWENGKISYTFVVEVE